MRQILLIPLICYLALLMEFALFDLFGRWGGASLLLLVVIFFNLYSGIRYSLWAALWAGMMKDCFSTLPFGAHVFVFGVCAYVSTYIRRYAYERGSDLSKLWMVFCVVTLQTLLMGALHDMIFEGIRWRDVWAGIWGPTVVTTLLVALFVFDALGGWMRRWRIS
ncbi:MAG: rod shape-determining protein MreD [Elusimicrobia bacterium]|nr:rod shape-determining protein MreD [Elusimicrobiota bacterium]